MKTFFRCFFVCAMLTSCSKIESNNDPVIGIWYNSVKTATNVNKMVVDKEEWIFNDVYLGRFHVYNDGEITFLTDFKWSLEGDVYTISYPAADFEEEYVKINKTEEGMYLVRTTGMNFATKQN